MYSDLATCGETGANEKRRVRNRRARIAWDSPLAGTSLPQPLGVSLHQPHNIILNFSSLSLAGISHVLEYAGVCGYCF